MANAVYASEDIIEVQWPMANAVYASEDIIEVLDHKLDDRDEISFKMRVKSSGAYHTDENNSLNWRCPKCTFSNQFTRISCEMCDEPHCSFDEIYEHVWKNVLSYHPPNTTHVCRWMKCTKCTKWRTAKVPISCTKTQQPPSDWCCPPGQCNTQQAPPSNATHPPFEILALKVERDLISLKEHGLKPQALKTMQVQIRAYTT
eukprot:86112_1